MAELNSEQETLLKKIQKQRNEMLLDFGNYLFSLQREEDLAFITYSNEQVRIERFRKVQPIDISNWQLRKEQMARSESRAKESNLILTK